MSVQDNKCTICNWEEKKIQTIINREFIYYNIVHHAGIKKSKVNVCIIIWEDVSIMLVAFLKKQLAQQN